MQKDMYCEYCGNNINEKNPFCPFCGSPTVGIRGQQLREEPEKKPEPQEPPQQTPSVAGATISMVTYIAISVFCFVLPFIGIYLFFAWMKEEPTKSAVAGVATFFSVALAFLLIFSTV